jgi:hypothetical protein
MRHSQIDSIVRAEPIACWLANLLLRSAAAAQLFFSTAGSLTHVTRQLDDA